MYIYTLNTYICNIYIINIHICLFIFYIYLYHIMRTCICFFYNLNCFPTYLIKP